MRDAICAPRSTLPTNRDRARLCTAFSKAQNRLAIHRICTGDPFLAILEAVTIIVHIRVKRQIGIMLFPCVRQTILIFISRVHIEQFRLLSTRRLVRLRRDVYLSLCNDLLVPIACDRNRNFVNNRYRAGR